MASLVVGVLPMASQSFSSAASHLSFSRSESLSSSLSTTRAASVSIAPSSATVALVVYCGRGDRKTAKGKRFNHSFGNARPRNKKMGRGPPRVPTPPSPPRKDRFEDNETVEIELDESLFSN